jgi:hypothetical protein
MQLQHIDLESTGGKVGRDGDVSGCRRPVHQNSMVAPRVDATDA